MALDTATARAHVTSPTGAVTAIRDGGRIVFGRGPDADLIVAAGRGLSRRAGVISAVAGGAWVANISRTHALYAEGDGYRVRLPRMDEAGDPAAALEPSKGWFLREGAALMRRCARLPEVERAAIELVDLAEFTPMEAALALGVSRVAFRKRLSRARSRLRKEHQGNE